MPTDSQDARCSAAQPRLWEPLEVYRKGERVIDRERDDVRHMEEGGVFEALADHRAGYLNPRYVAKDRPGEFWKRVSE